MLREEWSLGSALTLVYMSRQKSNNKLADYVTVVVDSHEVVEVVDLFCGMLAAWYQSDWAQLSQKESNKSRICCHSNEQSTPKVPIDKIKFMIEYSRMLNRPVAHKKLVFNIVS